MPDTIIHAPIYGRSPAMQVLQAMRDLKRAMIYSLNPIDPKIMRHTNAIEVCIPNDWLNRFLLNHKGLRNWLRWHFT